MTVTLCNKNYISNKETKTNNRELQETTIYFFHKTQDEKRNLLGIK